MQREDAQIHTLNAFGCNVFVAPGLECTPFCESVTIITEYFCNEGPCINPISMPEWSLKPPHPPRNQRTQIRKGYQVSRWPVSLTFRHLGTLWRIRGSVQRWPTTNLSESESETCHIPAKSQYLARDTLPVLCEVSNSFIFLIRNAPFSGRSFR